MDPVKRVLESTSWACKHPEIASLVQVDVAREESFAREILFSMGENPDKDTEKDTEKATGNHSFSVEWNEDDLHFRDTVDEEALLRYILVVDALNFCFWPKEGLEYEVLSKTLADLIRLSPHKLSPESLAALSMDTFRGWFKGARADSLDHAPLFPLEEERVRLLREVGFVLLEKYNGSVRNLVEKASQSASALVRLVLEAFHGFQDHCVLAGRQVFLYKRAQIFVGDVWGAFGGRGIGTFHDIEALTMFADYRVPQYLRHVGIFEYRIDLAKKVDENVELISGSVEEIAIRVHTVQSVQRIRNAIEKIIGKSITSIQLDWYLWQVAEKIKHEMQPHHKVMTIYY